MHALPPAHPPALTQMEWYDEVPRGIARHAVFGIGLMIAAFGGFGLWAFKAPLAAAVISQGSFVATGQNKIVQHLEGGIIKEILVEEGDLVSVGQPIVRLDETAAQANKRELYLRQARLEATEARLLAEYNGLERMDFATRLEDGRTDPEIATILESQELAFKVSRSQLDNDLALLGRNIEALEVRADGYRVQLDALRLRAEILKEELEAKEDLLKKGLVRRFEVSQIQRAVIESDGQIGRLEAEIAEISQVRAKYEIEIGKAQSEYQQAALDELQPIQAELESVREKARKAESILARSDVAAPVSGTVIRLHYHTPGGVIESGKAIAEILPADAPLIVEIQVPRTEVDSVRTGQTATVRLTALNQRTTPVLDGTVIYRSADAISEKQDGVTMEVYVARVALPPEQLARVRGFSPTPGMPAEVMVQTAERTFFDYLSKPIRDSMQRAFREQ